MENALAKAPGNALGNALEKKLGKNLGKMPWEMPCEKPWEKLWEKLLGMAQSNLTSHVKVTKTPQKHFMNVLRCFDDHQM